ncbi:MAG: radical SAM protein [Methanocellales archaeon]
MTSGYKIVLTADRTLMSEYSDKIFLGFSACIPKGLILDQIYFSLLCPSVKVNDDGSVKHAPYGTRKIEAALLNSGFKREDIVVAHPDCLEKVVGSNTKVIGITENDPLGIGPATSTFTQLFGKQAYMALKFKELLNNKAIQIHRPKIIVGGPGTWQLEDEKIRRELGIDCVVIGEGEKVAPILFEKAINNEELPGVVYGEPALESEIPIIQGASISGIVEIARGCGRGCDFCIPTLQRFRCFSIDHILQEVEVNLRAGRNPLLHAEDVLRYKARGWEVNKEAVIDLFKTIKQLGVNSIGISHFSLSSVASAPDLIEEISNILDVNEKRWISGQTGIETGSPKLMREHMMGKCKPFKPEDWRNVVVTAFEILAKNSWVPCATLILGLPGEDERDVDSTIDLVEELSNFKSLIVPLFFVSEGRLKNRVESFSLDKMTLKHSELFLKCWEHNLNWGEVLVKEYFEGKKHMLKLLFSYAFKQGRKLIQKCYNDYECNILAMAKDARNGKVKSFNLGEIISLRQIASLLH